MPRLPPDFAKKLNPTIAASVPSQWTRQEQIDVDGINYSIFVARHGDKFLAISVCDKCCEQASVNVESTTSQSARDRAMVGLRLHHDSNHCRPLPPH